MMPPPTLPGLLLRNASSRAARPAFRHRSRGIWHTLSWAGFAATVRGFALGLAAHGFGAGARLAVIGENHPRCYAALLAAQCLGGLALPLDPDGDPAVTERRLREAGASVLLVEHREQADFSRVLAPPALVIGRLARPDIMSFDSVIAAGETFAALHPGFFEDEAARRMPEDPAVLLAGAPEAPLFELSHAALVGAAQTLAARERLGPTEQAFCYLPLAALGELVYSLSLGLLCGFCCNCPERPDTVPRDLREIGPTFLLAPPRALDLLAADLDRRLGGASGVKRRAFQRFRAAALRAEELRESGRAVPPGLRLSCALGGLVIDAPVRDLMGLRRTRFIHVGPGVPTSGTAAFIRSLGLTLRPASFVDPAELPHQPARELSDA